MQLGEEYLRLNEELGGAGVTVQTKEDPKHSCLLDKLDPVSPLATDQAEMNCV